MEFYLQFIFLLAVLKYALKASMNTRLWVILLYPLCAALFAYLIYPWMILQRGDSFTAILSDKGLVADCAVLITIEAVLGILSSVFILDNYFAPKTERKRSVFLLKVVPGVLVFIGIAYFQLAFFKQFVGIPFGRMAFAYSMVVFLVITFAALLLRFLIKGESPKLELKITINLIILAVVLFVNASLADYSVSDSATYVEWKALAADVLFFVLMALLGVYLFKYRETLRQWLASNKTDKI